MEQSSTSLVCLKRLFKISHCYLGEEPKNVGEDIMDLPEASVCRAHGEEGGLREEDSVWDAWKGYSPLMPHSK